MKTIFVMALAAGSTFAQSAPAPASGTGSSAAPASATTKASAVKSKKTVKPVVPITIPATAVDQGDGSYRYVDPKGAAWIYRKTPFGVSRATEASLSSQSVGQTPFGQSKSQPGVPVAVKPPVDPAPGTQDDPDARVTAVAKGDSIEFARPTPFGVTKWQKNKNDLNTSEQKIWARMQPKGKQ